VVGSLDDTTGRLLGSPKQPVSRKDRLALGGACGEVHSSERMDRDALRRVLDVQR
jgi:hypothetical protein